MSIGPLSLLLLKCRVCSVLLGLWLVGCAAPQRTFHPAEPEQATENTAEVSPLEPAEESPSLWPKWLGSFPGSKPAAVESPPQRIPLPRTDSQDPLAPSPPGLSRSPDFNGF